MPHSPEPSAICSCKTDNARDAKKTKHNIYLATEGSELPTMFVFFGGGTGTVLDLNLSSFKKKKTYTCFRSGPGRLTWEDWKFSREGGEHENSRAGRDYDVYEMLRVSGRGRNPFFSLVTGQKMNMSARLVFGKGRPAPKHLSFAFPQTDSLRKGSRSAGGKKRMFSFSLRCRLGIIRGRTKGKVFS